VELVLKVGRRGEIYTTKEVRAIVGIKEGGLVRAVVEKGRLIIEPIPSIEEILREPPLLELTPSEAERISEEAQKEAGVYG